MSFHFPFVLNSSSFRILFILYAGQLRFNEIPATPGGGGVGPPTENGLSIFDP